MNAGIYGRPTAAELVAAAAEFLETEIADATSGSVNFHARVAANTLRIVHRELEHGTAGAARAHTALDTLGYPDEAALAAAVRAGDLDGRDADVLACLRAVVAERLAVAHPGYDREQR